MGDAFHMGMWQGNLSFLLGVATTGRHDQVMYVESNPMEGDVASKVQRALRTAKDAIVLRGTVTLIEGRASGVVLREVQAHVQPGKADVTRKLVEAGNEQLMSRFEAMAVTAVQETCKRQGVSIPGLETLGAGQPVAAPVTPVAAAVETEAPINDARFAARVSAADVVDDDEGFDFGAFPGDEEGSVV